ncbi:MAG: energy transducer TonB [Flavobacteriales bacterium]|nr:energy transducer TonB [Flavobacteriales bacterium]
MFLPFVALGQQKNGETETVFNLVEKMPRFKGCENAKSEELAAECTQTEIARFLSKTIVYPQKAKVAGVEGFVYVSFVVNTKGKVTEIKLLKGIGFGCDEEALKAVSKFPKFTPGIQRGKPVKVMFNLPISFKLR